MCAHGYRTKGSGGGSDDDDIIIMATAAFLRAGDFFYCCGSGTALFPLSNNLDFAIGENSNDHLSWRPCLLRAVGRSI